MACSSGCPTPGAHATWGECVRAKDTRVAYCQSARGHDATTQKRWDRELGAYRDAHAQGIRPDGTTMPKIEAAVRASDETGTAYGVRAA